MESSLSRPHASLSKKRLMELNIKFEPKNDGTITSVSPEAELTPAHAQNTLSRELPILFGHQ